MATFKAAPNADISGTHYHDVDISASLPTMLKKLGTEHIRNHASKTQYEWFFKDEEGHVVSVYDWKEYGNPAPRVWHIGALRKVDAVNFKRWFESL